MGFLVPGSTNTGGSPITRNSDLRGFFLDQNPSYFSDLNGFCSCIEQILSDSSFDYSL